MEVLQELEELVLVPSEDALDLWWLFRVCDEHLQCLELDTTVSDDAGGDIP